MIDLLPLVGRLLTRSPLKSVESVAFLLHRFIHWRVDKRRRNHPNDIRSFERRIYSQHGEDGILAELFYRLGGSAGTFVEFGVGDGLECNCALLARQYRWQGLMIESDDVSFNAVVEAYRPYPEVAIRKHFVTAENIVAIFDSAQIPRKFELLSIDVDGNDYWLWKALSEYRPKIVVIEFNPCFKPPLEWTHEYDAAFQWRHDWDYGASLAALEALGRDLGYVLIGTDSSATNAFFVRSDLASSVRFPPLTATAAFAGSTPHPAFARRRPP